MLINTIKLSENTFELITTADIQNDWQNGITSIMELPAGTYLFSQVVPPNDNISSEYDWLIGRNIHYPTKNEILELFSLFKKINHNDFLLENQSINNWLENTCQNEEKRKEIIDRHRKTSEEYRLMANYREVTDDIFVSIRHFMVSGEK